MSDRPEQLTVIATEGQVHNLLRCFAELSEHAHEGQWDPADAHRTAGLIVMCTCDESRAQILANPNVPESMKIPHDGIGTDHASVGMFQQQVPMWGTAADCMHPRTSTRKFIRRAQARGLTRHHSMPWHEAVQAVQVSADPTGSNYARYYDQAEKFLAEHWSTEFMKGIR